MGDYDTLETVILWGVSALAIGFVGFLAYLHLPKKPRHRKRSHRPRSDEPESRADDEIPKP